MAEINNVASSAYAGNDSNDKDSLACASDASSVENFQSDSEYSDCLTSPSRKAHHQNSNGTDAGSTLTDGDSTLNYYSADSLSELPPDTPTNLDPEDGDTLQLEDTSDHTYCKLDSTQLQGSDTTIHEQKLPEIIDNEKTVPNTNHFHEEPKDIKNEPNISQETKGIKNDTYVSQETKEIENGPNVSLISSKKETESEEEEEEDEQEADVDIVEEEFYNQHALSSDLVLLRRQKCDPNPSLPKTVTVLTTEWGGKLYLVGTAHFSLESQEDVAKTIRATQPDLVVVELCRSRVSILFLDEKTILEESKMINLQKMSAIIRQNGVKQGILYLLMLNVSAHLTRQLGMPPGGEFKRAFTEAKKVPGCLIQLGDRPLQITLQRALAYLTLWQKMKLAWYLLTSSRESISKEDVEKCKERDLLEQLLAEISGEFPSFSEILLEERNLYLAYSLRMACRPAMATSSGETVPRVVVGVVGMGHVPGIVKHWNTVTEEDIKPIMEIPESTLATRIMKKTIRLSLMAALVWGCYKLVPRSVTSSLLPQQPYQAVSGYISSMHQRVLTLLKL